MVKSFNASGAILVAAMGLCWPLTAAATPPTTPLGQVERWADQLDSDQARQRTAAIDRLRRHAAIDDAKHDVVAQTVARRSLTDTLETQAVTLRLLRLLRQDRLDRQLDDWIVTSRRQRRPTTPPTDWPDDIDARWHRFEQRADSSLETAIVFCNFIRGTDSHERIAPDVVRLAWHLGCEAPDAVQLYRVPGQRTLEQLVAPEASAQTASTPTHRVLAKLIDDAIQRNPYGWSVRDRLQVAWTHGRSTVAMQLCVDVLNDRDRSPLDQAYALLAADRWGRLDLADQIELRLRDSRILRVPPGELVWIRPRRQAAAGPWPVQTVRTRLQDVAIMLWMNDHDVDARRFGMDGLRADPIWGTRLPSIGFVSTAERGAALRFIVDSES